MSNMDQWCSFWQNTDYVPSSQNMDFGISRPWPDWFEGEAKRKCIQWIKDHCQKQTIIGGWKYVEPEQGKYKWDYIDRCIEIADECGLKKYYHCLFWDHPGWFKPTWLNADVDRDHYISMWRKWVDVLAERYNDQIDEWEIVNESIIKQDWDPRKRIIVEDGFYKAFQHANGVLKGRQGINLAVEIFQHLDWYGQDAQEYRIISDLLDRGIRLDFIGIQHHAWYDLWERESYHPERIHKSLSLLSGFRLPVYITEFSVYAPPHEKDKQAMLLNKILGFWRSFPQVESLVYWLTKDSFSYFGDQASALTDHEFNPYPIFHELSNILERSTR